MGKTYKDRKETREFNRARRMSSGPKMKPYKRNEYVQSNRLQSEKENCYT